MPFPLPLHSCDSWVFVKENPDRKKNYYKDFLHLIEAGNEKFVKSILYLLYVYFKVNSICLFLKCFFLQNQDIQHYHHHHRHFYVHQHHHYFYLGKTYIYVTSNTIIILNLLF